jgi:hypothetical protein
MKTPQQIRNEVEKEERVINPYKRIEDINQELIILGKEEEQLKRLSKRLQGNRLGENGTEQLLLIIEKNSLELSINWFEIYCLGYNQQGQLRKQNPLDFERSVDTDGQSLVGTENIRDKNSHLAENNPEVTSND